jgi:hypothetical protein
MFVIGLFCLFPLCYPLILDAEIINSQYLHAGVLPCGLKAKKSSDYSSLRQKGRAETKAVSLCSGKIP